MSKPVYEYIFKLGTGELNIKFADQISDETINRLSEIAEASNNELNYKVLNSSAYKFNKSQLDIPFFVHPLFIKYLDFCIKIFDLNNKLSVLKINDSVSDKISDVFTIDSKNDAITKSQSILITSNKLLKLFAIKELTDYLNTQKIPSYLISSDIIFASFGNLRWKLSLKPEQFDDSVDFKLYNEFAIVNLPHKKGTEVQKFALKAEKIHPTKILIGKNLVHLEFLASQLEEFEYHYQYEEFTKKHKIKMILAEAGKTTLLE